MWKKLFWIALLALLMAGAWHYYRWHHLPTSVTVRFQGFSPAPATPVFISLESPADLDRLRAAYRDSTAKHARIIADLKKQQAAVERQLADLETRAVDVDGDIRNTTLRFEDEAKKIWEEEQKKLQAEYDKQKTDLYNTVQERVKKLKLNYEKVIPVNTPEAWLNAYRLALYDVPKEVNTALERQWADDLLDKWHKYDTEWNNRLNLAMQKSRAIDDKRAAAVATLSVSKPVTDTRRAPLEAQLSRLKREQTLHEEQARSLNADFLPRLRTTLEARMILNHAAGSSGSSSFEDVTLKPGPYLVYLFQDSDQGGQVWIKPFTLKLKSANEVTLRAEDAKPLISYLE
ncbi:MAG: hypothetical protein SFY92_10415 [Verrucomicrobiae bacterium]|nr:hypothetical protein [Verrucomicrobiae bacterium]